ncbi:hypothetical protein OsJ_26740 [Oryza sativa Japonica Group]|uniref:Uncharacterized protein n=1 Tax=Oryza sativa subsp. japonica TaxID=39947 RepID=B9G030_ORYSJ|nr:hypothetical protein OsJ_26740 [Oryza sativa Japonica Group]
MRAEFIAWEDAGAVGHRDVEANAGAVGDPRVSRCEYVEPESMRVYSSTSPRRTMHMTCTRELAASGVVVEESSSASVYSGSRKKRHRQTSGGGSRIGDGRAEQQPVGGGGRPPVVVGTGGAPPTHGIRRNGQTHGIYENTRSGDGR